MKRIHIDPSAVIGPLFRREQYRNTSLRFAPPRRVSEFAARELGRPRIVRVFITLDEFYDYRDDSYHPNYRIGVNRYDDDDAIHWYDRHRSKPSDVYFADYLKSVSDNADELLLCFRRYEHEAMNDVLGFDKYCGIVKAAIKHCKELAPNLRYIEVLNEWACSHFGGLDDDGYYRIYQAAYRIINELNDELQSGMLVGGPTTATAHFRQIGEFLKRLDADQSPEKRLDFISFHDYSSGDRPVRVHELRQQLDDWLKEFGLPLNIPTFVTEIGTHEGAKMKGLEDVNQLNAAGVATLLEHWRRCHDTIAFPWCQYHDPEIQYWSTQILPDGTLTAHGRLMKMLALHRENEIQVHVAGADENGLGLYALASRDEHAVAVQLWNHGKTSEPVEVEISLPAAGIKRIREYRVKEERDLPATTRFHVQLEPHDLWMIVIETGD